jgi:putative ABC transport system permease protein
MGGPWCSGGGGGAGSAAAHVASAPRVAIINEALARRFFTGEDPLGKQINISNGPDAWRQIVGVVGDVKHDRLDTPVPLQMYEPFAQQPLSGLTFVIRTAGPVADLAGAIRSAIIEVDPDQPIDSVKTLEEWLARSVARQRFAMLLFAVFSAVALVLAGVGIYGVMAYFVTQRTAEIGIRRALGAQTGHVLRLVLRQGGRLVALGIGAGVVGALALTRFLAAMVYGVSPRDPLTFVAIAALLAAIAAIACLLPARRAARVDPMAALRTE